MPNIDNLEIKISTSAGQASRELESLASSLEKVKGAGNYPTSLTSYAKNLDKLGATLDKIDVTKLAKLDTLAQTLKSLEGVGDVKISKTLTNGIENIINQANKISEGNLKKLERLSKAIGSLGTLQSGEGNTLAVKFSGLDKVDSQLKNINGQLKISTVLTGGFKNSVNLLGNAWSKVAGIVTSVAVYIKKLLPMIKSGVDSANSYIKTLNKFNVVMGDYAQSEYDYAMRVNEVMGIDPAEWLDVESTFMTLGTGFGIASDRASIMSRQLTQLSYDIASFNNIDISDSIQRVQSAFAGELEPVRRLGYDLSQTRLQMYATELGIDSLVSSMTQAEKAQLRYYALMNQVVEAQHDMAITLNAPSNQLRILHSYLNQASRALGNVFIPLLNKVIPYAIAGARAIRTFADAIASLFGFELPTFDDSIRGMSNLADTTATVADNLGSGARQAQKFKDNLQKFDELNVLKSPNDSGSGGSGNALDPSNWDWELPTYDFLEGATQSNVDSIYNRLMRFFSFEDINAIEIGRTIGNKFNEILNRIDVQSSGRILGTKITDIFELAFGFFDTFSGYNFGYRISLAVQGFFEGIDGYTIGRALSEGLKDALDIAIGFFSNSQMLDEFANDFIGLIAGIDWSGLLARSLRLATAILNGITRVFRDIISGRGFTSSFNDAIPSNVSPTDNSSIASRIAYETNMSLDSSRQRQALYGGSFGDNLVNQMANSLTSADISNLVSALANLLKTAWDLAFNLFVTGARSLGEEFWATVSDLTLGWHYDTSGNIVVYNPNDTQTLTELIDNSTNPRSNDGGPSSRRGGGAHSGGGGSHTGGTHGSSRRGGGTVHHSTSSHSSSTRTLGDWVEETFSGGTPADLVSQMVITNLDPAMFNNEVYDQWADWWDRLWGRNVDEAEKNVTAFTKTSTKNMNNYGRSFVRTGNDIRNNIIAQDDTFERLTQDVNNGSTAMISNFDTLANKISTDTVTKFNEAKGNINATITSLTTETRASFSNLSTAVVNSMHETNSALVSPLNNIRSQITQTYRTAGDEAVNSINDLSSRMNTALGVLVNASEQQMNGYTSKWNELHSATRGVSNSVIGGAENMANAVIDAFNSLQDATGSIVIDVPGYKFQAHNLQRLFHIRIPRMAKGGSVKNSTYANIGEAGKEAVIPLDRDTTWADTFIAKTQEANAPALAEQNALLRQEIEILRKIADKELTISSTDVYSAVRTENDMAIKRTGSNPLAI